MDSTCLHFYHPPVAMYHHGQKTEKWSNCTWHSADQSTIHEAFEDLRKIMMKNRKVCVRFICICAMSQRHPLAVSCSLFLPLSLSDLWSNLSQPADHTIACDGLASLWHPWQRVCEDRSQTGARQEEKACWFLLFSPSLPFPRCNGAHAAICARLAGCVKRMWGRTQSGLLIIYYSIHSLPVPPGSAQPPTHGRPFNKRSRRINSTLIGEPAAAGER